MKKKEDSLKVSSKWIVDFILKKDICPFAKKPFELGLFHMEKTRHTDHKDQLEFFFNQLKLIQKSPREKISNSFLVFERGAPEFYEFLEFFYQCEALLEEIVPTHEFQIVCFHPFFKFKGEERDARINYVNRSPYPSIHILRSVEVELALEDQGAGLKISQQNEEKLKALSKADFDFIKKRGFT